MFALSEQPVILNEKHLVAFAGAGGELSGIDDSHHSSPLAEESLVLEAGGGLRNAGAPYS
jgi:hypothetical protein